MSKWQPTISGQLIELRPLRPEDWNELYAVASDPLIWEQHPANDRYKSEVFGRFFDEALACGGAFAVMDRQTGKIIGSSRFDYYDEQNDEIEIGWTFLARGYWGGVYNGELKRLMLDHAFKFVSSVVFLIGPNNWRSRRAIEKIGAIYDGTRRRGAGPESVVYRIRRDNSRRST